MHARLCELTPDFLQMLAGLCSVGEIVYSGMRGLESLDDSTTPEEVLK
jgi:hypothetical protein